MQDMRQDENQRQVTPAPETLLSLIQGYDGHFTDTGMEVLGIRHDDWTRISAALRAALEFSRLTDEAMTYPPQFRGQVVIAMQLAEEAHKKFRALVGTKGGEP